MRRENYHHREVFRVKIQAYALSITYFKGLLVLR